MNNLVEVTNHNNVLVTSSRNIAKVFNKEHKNVLRDVRSILEHNKDANFNQLNFELVTFIDDKGEQRPEYLLTRDGTMLLVMGYTGEKALELKTAYIKRFNEMEAYIKNQQLSSLSRETLDMYSLVLEKAGITGNQLALSLDKAVRAKTGESALALTGTVLVAETQGQLYTPTQLGKELGISAQKVNFVLGSLELQKRVDSQWELTQAGKEKGGIYLDTNKRHSNGTPVRQLKWPLDVLKDIKDFIEELDR